MKKILSTFIILMMLFSIYSVNAENNEGIIGEIISDGDSFILSYLNELGDITGTSTFTSDDGLKITLNSNSITIDDKTYIVESGEILSRNIANLRVFELTDYNKDRVLNINLNIEYEDIIIEDKVGSDGSQYRETSTNQVLTLNLGDKVYVSKRSYNFSNTRISNIPKAFQGMWKSTNGDYLFVGFDSIMFNGETYQMSPYVTTTIKEVSKLFDEALLDLNTVNIETGAPEQIVMGFNDDRLVLQKGNMRQGKSTVIGYYTLQNESFDSEILKRVDAKQIEYYGDSPIVKKILELEGITRFKEYEVLKFIDVSSFEAPKNPLEVNLVWDLGKFDFDVPPQVVSGRTMVPLRALFEKFGYTMTWLEEENTVLAEKDNLKIYLPIGSAIMDIYDYSSGENKTVQMDVPAQIIDGRTLVPLRFVSEYVGLSVEWYGENRTVILRGKIKE